MNSGSFDKKIKARLFKSGEVTIATRNQKVGKNLNEFNVRVVDYNYKHVKYYTLVHD